MEEAIKKADALIEALPYIQRFAGKPVVIKFGGNAMENSQILEDVLKDVVFLASVGIRPLLVHGGGPQISTAMQQAGLAPTFVQGHRVTDEAALDVVVRVLTGEINGEIRRIIESHGGRAQSTFHDGHSWLRARRKLMAVEDEAGRKQEIDIGFVGEVTDVDAGRILAAGAAGTVLAIPPIGEDDSGQLYNVNADTVAAAVAVALQAEKVVFLSNVHGIMAEPGNDESLLSTVSERRVEELIRNGVISGGMLPKVAACIAALDVGVPKAHIIDGRLPHSLLLEIFTDRGIGTQIVKD
jgi:acetylglutamate kinase